mgnify:CR=1 FL=1
MNFGIKKRERNRGDEVPSHPLVANPPSVFPQMPEQNGLNFRNKMVTNAGTKQPQLPEQNDHKCRNKTASTSGTKRSQMPEKEWFFLDQNNIFYIFALKIKELWQNTRNA